MSKSIYLFSNNIAEGNRQMKQLLGGKGANLAEMAKLGLPIPPGFTITTEECRKYYKDKSGFENLKKEIDKGLSFIEQEIGRKFSDPNNPLLVSVRSGAYISMPGMMDTVLNLGLNDEIVEKLAQNSNNSKFVFDSYRRFLQMYGDVVLGISHFLFEDIILDIKQEHDILNDSDLRVEDLQTLCHEFKRIIKENSKIPFSSDSKEHLYQAIKAVFDSWMNERAVVYRNLHNIPDGAGTAINIQAMVFGNLNDSSATGVLFSRNPANGGKRIYGEYLTNAQGEDVVAGIRTPQQITILSKQEQKSSKAAMEEEMPKIYQELCNIAGRLEQHYSDMQDIEFTIEQDKLWILQTRSGKRTTQAAVKIAVDLVKEGLISKEEAILRIKPESLNQLLYPQIDETQNYTILTKALPASPGAACGKVVFNPSEVERLAKKNIDTILVRIETSPEDINGMYLAKGIVTARGGMTSHAAVVARGMGKCCVSGANQIKIDYNRKEFKVGEYTIKEGDEIGLNGTTGEVILGKIIMKAPEFAEEFRLFMSWVDSSRKTRVRTNAETSKDIEIARNFNAEGIGLCRTEHMFFNKNRILAIRKMIMAKDSVSRENILSELIAYQQQDFFEIFTLMQELPVNIRLLDPPLHEFLPDSAKDIEDFAKQANMDIKSVKARLSELKENNPMLGHRGCRVGITYPGIYRMQIDAILYAAIKAIDKCGITPDIEIMIPFIIDRKEFSVLKQLVLTEKERIEKESKQKLKLKIGAMIELPRAALNAADIAMDAEFFSFGTNDLTQTTLGISRDDSAAFLKQYISEHLILAKDPFVTLDIDGVGKLIEIASTTARHARPKIKLGICGEHGGDPESIEFCIKQGLDYVSCSPFRVPIARLAVAQSEIRLQLEAQQ